jgi:hypothetical protein
MDKCSWNSCHVFFPFKKSFSLNINDISLLLNLSFFIFIFCKQKKVCGIRLGMRELESDKKCEKVRKNGQDKKRFRADSPLSLFIYFLVALIVPIFVLCSHETFFFSSKVHDVSYNNKTTINMRLPRAC